eukprot:TRINITY_DN5747_c2_g1_i2.p1 TRINITY_DN5747_c2_g1~~TRINITY_DN5747_c2_g1_i2.p1  ORF type:complete len:597 (+),score=125.08 TRINITY_DN5747_c2_g1_i2:73-1863(+)
MPPKRPAPLSDDVFGQNKANGTPLVNISGATVLGATNNGVPLPVKNTFIDVPSGLTPSHFATGRGQALLTAPPDLNIAPGFVQRAMAQASTTSTMTKTVIHQSGIVPSSPQASAPRRVMHTPLATPSPSAAIGFSSQWSAASGAVRTTVPQNGTTSVYTPFPQGGIQYTMSPTSGRAGILQALNENAGAPTATFTTVPNAPSVYSAPPPTVQVYQQQPMQMMPLQTIPQKDADDDEDDDSDAELPEELKNFNPEDAPQPPPGALHPSLGSEAHNEGTCKRCCFFPRGRCTNGYNCEFCHYEHEKRKRKNKKKKKKDSVTTYQAADGRTVVMGAPVQMQTYQQLPAQQIQAPVTYIQQTGPAPSYAAPPPPSTVCQAPPGYNEVPPPHIFQSQPQPPQMQPYPSSPTKPPPATYMPPYNPPSPDRYSQPPPPLATQQPVSMPPQAPPPGQHHVIYGPTHAASSGSQQPALQAYMMPPQQLAQQQQLAPPQQMIPQQLPAPQMQPPPQAIQQHQAGYAPPPFQAPSLAPALYETMPPPPMSSPKMGQASGVAMPPPMNSPKLPRTMLPPMEAYPQQHFAQPSVPNGGVWMESASPMGR